MHISLHYGAAVKWGQKWTTLKNYFSMDSDQRVSKFCTYPPQLPNNPNKYKYEKQIFEKWGENPKNLLGVSSQVKIGLKKILLQKGFLFIKWTF